MINTIIVVDTENGFIQRLRTKLEEQGISDLFEVEEIVPTVSIENESEMIRKCVTDVSNSIVSAPHKVVAIFVDIVIYHGTSLDTSGIDIAVQIKTLHPDIPVFSMTGVEHTENVPDFFSEATMESIDGVFVKSFLLKKDFSARRLKTMLEKGRVKCSQRTTTVLAKERTIHVPDLAKSAYNSDNIDPRVRREIASLGEGDFWTLVLEMFPNSQGVVSYIAQGRSGTVVFRVNARFVEPGVSPTFPKRWILKVGFDKGLLEKEVSNYSLINRTPVPRRHYPHLFEARVRTVGRLTGFALELEEDAETLLESFDAQAPKPLEPSQVATNIIQKLSFIYGYPDLKISRVWSEYFAIDETLAIDLLSFLSENEKVIRSTIGEKSISDVRLLVQTKGMSLGSFLNFDKEVDRRTIHGDLNSRNVLISSDGNPVFIDFALRRQDHVAKDAAKLERDVIFRVLDHNSPHEYDWARLEHWNQLTLLNRKGYIFAGFDASQYSDPAVARSASFVSHLRTALKGVSPNILEEEYAAAIISFCLTAILHPQISFQKKVFAVTYINSVLQVFEK